MSISVYESKLKEIMREVIREEFINLSVNLLPFVSDEEMEEINQCHDSEDLNENTNDFIDMTEWLGR
ncbi:MAG: hypothetical protein HQK88_06935 [Nitrospirae bacterium]|nr:hypothetical protein [Nitrospirota bacterium]MBF0535029.1 hypothetical protein [Nitrospirota bacterium]MBF0616537.1 hypothetical protein [Nitrospirota bacterium]